MPRKMRVQYPGAMYHVMSHGDQRDDIFLADVDRPVCVRHACAAARQAGHAQAGMTSSRLWLSEDDPGKVAIVLRLRRETTLTIKAIAARVQLGTYHTANVRLHRAMKERSASSESGGDSAQATIAK